MTPYRRLFEATGTKLEFTNHQDVLTFSVNDDEYTGRVYLDKDFDGRTTQDKLDYNNDTPPNWEAIEDFYNTHVASDIRKLRDGESRVYSL
jgi:hypothetical protein